MATSCPILTELALPQSLRGAAWFEVVPSVGSGQMRMVSVCGQYALCWVVKVESQSAVTPFWWNSDSRRPGRVGEEATLLGSGFSMWFTNDYHQAQSLGGLVLVTKSV